MAIGEGSSPSLHYIPLRGNVIEKQRAPAGCDTATQRAKSLLSPSSASPPMQLLPMGTTQTAAGWMSSSPLLLWWWDPESTLAFNRKQLMKFLANSFWKQKSGFFSKQFSAFLVLKAFCKCNLIFLEFRVLKMHHNDVKITRRKPNSRDIEAPGKVCSYNYQHGVILNFLASNEWSIQCLHFGCNGEWNDKDSWLVHLVFRLSATSKILINNWPWYLTQDKNLLLPFGNKCGYHKIRKHLSGAP